VPDKIAIMKGMGGTEKKGGGGVKMGAGYSLSQSGGALIGWRISEMKGYPHKIFIIFEKPVRRGTDCNATSRKRESFTPRTRKGTRD